MTKGANQSPEEIGEKPRLVEYFENDFSIFNSYADGLIERDRAYTGLRWNEVWFSRLKIVVLFLVAVLVFFLILIVLSRTFYSSPFAFLGEANKGPNEIQYVPVPDPNLSQTIEKQIIVEVPKYIPIEIPSSEGVVTNFNIFHTKETSLIGIQGVTTGLKFDSSSEKYPTVQWCYADGMKKVGNTHLRIDVGKVEGILTS